MWQGFSGQMITLLFGYLFHSPMAFDNRELSAASGGYKTLRYTQKIPA
jgi:hypothetical protein